MNKNDNADMLENEEHIMLCSPLSGLQYLVYTDAKGCFFIESPITGKLVRFRYDTESSELCCKVEYFLETINLCNSVEAANTSGYTKQRIGQMLKEKKIKGYRVYNTCVINADSVPTKGVNHD